MVLLLLILKIIVSMMLMPLMMMILTRKSVVVGAGQKPTPVKSWQVPPLSSSCLPPPICISFI